MLLSFVKRGSDPLELIPWIQLTTLFWFRERIVPRAVLYFTGEALEEDSDFEEEESDEDDDDEDGEFAPAF